MHKLLTQEDLADRWQVSIRCIEEYRRKGIISVVKDLPAIRFNPEDIRKIEGTKFERFSPLERKRLEKEIKELRQENERLEGILADTLAVLAPVIKRRSKDE